MCIITFIKETLVLYSCLSRVWCVKNWVTLESERVKSKRQRNGIEKFQHVILGRKSMYVAALTYIDAPTL